MNKIASSGSSLPADSFSAYLISHKKMILVACIISAATFLLLKYCFPYPDFFVDSINYVLWAALKFDVAYRPTGYSYFLRLTHAISSSPTFTILIQYLLFLPSSLFLFFSADYFFGIPTKWKWTLLIITILNPILIFQSNLISSDSLFCSLTVTWFTLCLWIIRKPNWLALVLQLVLLYLCFRVRYAAMFYPVIAGAAFLLCTAKLWYKLTGIALTSIIILFAVESQTNLNEQETGTHVFSGFSGWQIANNALYCYKKINVSTIDLPTSQTQVIDAQVKRYIDSVNTPDPVGYVYLWDMNSPLKKYLHIREYHDHTDYFKAWFAASVPMSDYGWYIVRNYPGAFMRYYILPNTANYCYPDAEVVANYNVSNVTLPPETKEWFNLDVDRLYTTFPDLQRNIVSIFPPVTLLLHIFNIGVVMLFLLICLRNRAKISVTIWRTFLFWLAFYGSFSAFTIFSTAVNLRYMNPFLALGFIVPFCLLAPLRQNKTN